MHNNQIQRVTGFVMPVGNGAVGKTSLALTLEKESLPEKWADSIQQIGKSYNLEFRYVSDALEINGQQFRVLQQYLVPPGQKSSELSEWGRSFDEVITIYRSVIRRLDVVLVSYNITDLDSYNDIEYWLEKVSKTIHDRTNFILVGTHLDKGDQREVSEKIVEVGVDYVYKLIQSLRVNWNGQVNAMEVSSISGENIKTLRKMVSNSILLASGLRAIENSQLN